MDNITKKQLETELTRDLRDLYVTELGVLEKMIEGGYMSADDGDHIRHLHRPAKQITAFIRLLLHGQTFEDSLRFLKSCLEENHGFLVEGLDKTLLKYLPKQGCDVVESTVTVHSHPQCLVTNVNTTFPIQKSRTNQINRSQDMFPPFGTDAETQTNQICRRWDMFPSFGTDAYSDSFSSSDPETNTDIATESEELGNNEFETFSKDLEGHLDQLVVKGHVDEDDSASFRKKSKRKVARFLKHKLSISILSPAELSAHNKDIDLIFDKINKDLNTGRALVTSMNMDNANTQFIHCYFRCCETLYNNNMSEAKTCVKTARRLLNFTTYKERFRSDLCTLETWLYLRTGKLSKMEEVLYTYGVTVYAFNCSELSKSKGWFHFEYARFYEQWMERKTIRLDLKVLRTEGIKHACKAVDAFAVSDSSDGKIGQGFALCLIAKLSLFCGQTFTITELDVTVDDIYRAKEALKQVGLMFDIAPETLRVDALLCHCDLQFRLGDTKTALEFALDAETLATKLKLQYSLTEANARIAALTSVNNRQ